MFRKRRTINRSSKMADKIRDHLANIHRSLGAIDAHLEDGERNIKSIGKPRGTEQIKEEEAMKDEEINEVSNKTLRSYADKAVGTRPEGRVRLALSKLVGLNGVKVRGTATKANEEVELDEHETRLQVYPHSVLPHEHDIKSLKKLAQHSGHDISDVTKVSYSHKSGDTHVYNVHFPASDDGTTKGKVYVKVNSQTGHQEFNEEFEQLAEIGDTDDGQGALRDYMRKAAHSFVKHDIKGDRVADTAEKQRSRGNIDAAKKTIAKAGKHWDKSYTRIIGMARAGKRIREGVEQLDEVGDTQRGRDALKSYVAKAKPKALGFGYKPKDEKDDRKAFKRSQGILRANDNIEKNEPLGREPKVHDLRHMDHDGDVYDHTQTHEHIKDGDVLHLHGNRSAIMYSAWPTMIHGDSEHLHSFAKGPDAAPTRYKASVAKAKSVVKGVKEEVEQVDEISKGLAKRYIDAASADLEKGNGPRSFPGAIDGTPSKNPKAKKRVAGRVMAASKMLPNILRGARIHATEEVEQVDESRLDKFEPKHVQGLYHYSHYEHPDGSFLQIRHGDKFQAVYRHGKDGKHEHFDDRKALKDRINGVKEEVENIDEGLRLLATHKSSDGTRHAKVYRDAEWEEHRVKYFENGKHLKDADSFHGDAEDAHDSAKYWLRTPKKVSEGKTYRADRDDYYSSVKGSNLRKALKRSAKIARAAKDQKRKSVDAVKVDEGVLASKDSTTKEFPHFVAHLQDRKTKEKFSLYHHRDDNTSHVLMNHKGEVEAGFIGKSHEVIDHLKHYNDVHKISEEVEQVDEISKNLALRYARAAAKDFDNLRSKGSAVDGAMAKKAMKRDEYKNLAHSKAFKELPSAKVMATEEIEQIDEIGDTSRGQRALKSYVAKSSKEGVRLAYVSGQHSRWARDGRDSSADASVRAGIESSKRMTGVARAAARIREEAEEVDEGKTFRVDADGATTKTIVKRKSYRDALKKASASAKRTARMKRVANDTTGGNTDEY